MASNSILTGHNDNIGKTFKTCRKMILTKVHNFRESTGFSAEKIQQRPSYNYNVFNIWAQ